MKVCATGPRETACSTSQIFIKHQGIPRNPRFEYSQLWEIFPVVGTKEPNPRTIHKSESVPGSQYFPLSKQQSGNSILHRHLPRGTCLFLSQAEVSLTAHRDGTKGHRAAQLTVRHRTHPSSAICPIPQPRLDDFIPSHYTDPCWAA